MKNSRKKSCVMEPLIFIPKFLNYFCNSSWRDAMKSSIENMVDLIAKIKSNSYQLYLNQVWIYIVYFELKSLHHRLPSFRFSHFPFKPHSLHNDRTHSGKFIANLSQAPAGWLRLIAKLSSRWQLQLYLNWASLIIISVPPASQPPNHLPGIGSKQLQIIIG